MTTKVELLQSVLPSRKLWAAWALALEAPEFRLRLLQDRSRQLRELALAAYR